VFNVQEAGMMAVFKRFEDIESWQQARALVNQVYTITKQGTFYRDIGLREQIRRASVSIMANIAEGYERGGKKEFIQFLSVAKGSAGEVRSHLYVANDQGYLNATTFDELYKRVEHICNLIGGLMRYLSGTDYSGTKYKKRETRNTKPSE
jgi:four helix bundle protein